jgi:tetratricopeptide (TPR) repeat protein
MMQARSTVVRRTSNLLGTEVRVRNQCDVGASGTPNCSRDALAYSANGLALLSGGRWREAADSFERSLATSRQTRAGLFLGGFTLTGLARAYFGMGEAERALATAKQAVQACEQARIQMWECRALLALARMRQATCGSSGKPEIDALLRRAALLIQDTGARSYEPFLHEAYAELAGLAGDGASRKRETR